MNKPTMKCLVGIVYSQGGTVLFDASPEVAALLREFGGVTPAIDAQTSHRWTLVIDRRFDLQEVKDYIESLNESGLPEPEAENMTGETEADMCSICGEAGHFATDCDVPDQGRKTMPWTRFWDMHSGGSQKEPWHFIFIEAPEEEAVSVFYAKFGHNPHRVTCTCCGSDYSIDEDEMLTQVTGFHRGCAVNSDGQYVEESKGDGFHPYQTLAEFVVRGDVRIISASEIEDWERHVYVPDEGYVWM